MNVDGTLGGLFGGVSQQPDILRRPGQCSEQINMMLDYTEGLKRRPKARTIGQIVEAHGDPSEVFVHWFEYEEKLHMLILGPASRAVYDTDGTQHTLAASAGVVTYLAKNDRTGVAGFDSDKLSSAQVGDYNIISNGNVIPTMAAETSTPTLETIVFHVKSGMEWGLTYSILHDADVISTYTAPAGDSVTLATIEKIQSNYIATQLQVGLDAWIAGAGATSGFTTALYGSTVVMTRTRPSSISTGTGGFSALNMRFDDSRSGAHTQLSAHEADEIDKLPPRSQHGHIVKIIGKESSDVDDWWMRFAADNGTAGVGRWVETVEPGATTHFDPISMPIALVPSTSGFVLNAIDGSTVDGIVLDTWKSRKVGNDDLNPLPTFIGGYIVALRTFQNRFCCMTESGVNMSRPRREFNFFAKTTRTVLATDPIQLEAPGDVLPQLHSMQDHERHLVMLGKTQQYATKGTAAITPDNAAMFQTTSLDTVPGVRPVTAGRVMFIPYRSGSYTGMREYTTGDVTDTNTSQDISTNINHYLDQGIQQVEVDRQKDILYVSSSVSAAKTSGTIYLYQYLWNGPERVVQAWHKWELPFQVVSMRVEETSLRIVGWSAQDGLVIYSLNTNLLEELDGDLYIHMDCAHTDQTVGATGLVDISTWTHPLAGATADDLLVVLTSGEYAGMRVQIDTYTYGGNIQLKSFGVGIGAETVRVGLKYTSEYTPTMPVRKDQNGAAIQTGSLTVGTLEAQMYETGAFNAHVIGKYHPEFLQRYSGRYAGASGNMVGRPAIQSAIFQVSVRQGAREVACRFETTEHTAMTFQSIEWTGMYVKRGQRL